MATVFFPSFDCVLIDVNGIRTPSASEIIDVYNITAASSLGTVTSDTDGIVAAGSFTATDGDIVEFSHASLPLTFRLKLAATAALAYTQNTITAYVMENLATLNATDTALLYAADTDNPDVAPVLIGSGKSGTTVEINYTTNVAKNLRIYAISQNDKEYAKTHFDTTSYDDIAIPALAYQPLDSDLTTLAANITAFGHSLVDDANAAAAQATLALLGANDRVLYQASGVVAQSANLTHNGTSLGVGGPTIGTINGTSFATVRGHFRSTGGGYLAMDAAGNSGILLNDSTQSADSRLWSILSASGIWSVSTMADAGTSTQRLSMNRTGQAVFGAGSALGSAVLSVEGAGGTSYTNADFHVRNSASPSKHLAIWYDNTNDVARLQAAHTGTAFKDLWLQYQGGSTVIGGNTSLLAGKKLSLTHDGTNAAFRLVPVSGAPSSLSDGDIWYDSSVNKFRARQNGASTDLIGGGGGGITNSAGNGVIAKSDGTNLVASQITDDGTIVAMAGIHGFSFDPSTVLVLGDYASAGNSNYIRLDDPNNQITIRARNYLEILDLPTSAPGGSNQVWNDSGTLKIT